MPEELIIAGLGPGNPGLVPIAAVDEAKSAVNVFVRTKYHPSVGVLTAHGIRISSFDQLYEECHSFQEVYSGIASRVLDAARTGKTVYFVPGSPMVMERSVELLLQESSVCGINVRIIPALSSADAVLTALKMTSRGYVLVDAYDLGDTSVELAGSTVPTIVSQVHDKFLMSQAKLWLLERIVPEFKVYIVRAAGVPGEERVLEVALEDLDRVLEPDHLTSVVVPPVSEKFLLRDTFGSTRWAGRKFDEFMTLIAKLRGEGGCPWDKNQTYESLTRYVLEEAYEVVEAVRDNNPEKLAEELGDLLLEIALYSQIGFERVEFDAAQVIEGISRKIVRRHPHVFGKENLKTPEDVRRRWEEIKMVEKGHRSDEGSLMDRVPKGLPALMRACKQQELAAGVGFDWDNVFGPLSKVEEELGEVRGAVEAGNPERISGEIGDLLYACVNLARHLQVDPEAALSGAIAKFAKRFREVEREVKGLDRNMKDLDLGTLDGFWEKAKQREKTDYKREE